MGQHTLVLRNKSKMTLRNLANPYPSIMPRSHIHGSPLQFYYGLNLKDDPANANFRSLIRMYSGVTTGFDLSTKDKVGKEPFGDMSDTDCYVLIRKVSVNNGNGMV